MIIPEIPASKPPNKTTSSDGKAMPIENTTTMMNMIRTFHNFLPYFDG